MTSIMANASRPFNQPLRSRPPAPRESRFARWSQPYAAILLALTLLYVVFQSIGDTQADPAATDHVNPLNSWIWLGLLALSVPVLRHRWHEVVALTLGCWILLVVYGYFGLSTVWALDQAASRRRFILALLQLILCTILVSGLRRRPMLHITIAVACSAAALIDLFALVAAPGHGMMDDGFAGFQTQKNQTGLVMMYGCLSAGSAFFLVQRRLWRIICVAATIMMAILLVLTRSTTSQSVVLSAAFVMPVLLAIARLRGRMIRVVALAFILVLVAVPAIYLAWCGLDGTDPMLPMRGVTFTGRTDIWFFVMDEIAKRPWIGAGYDSFWAVDPTVQPSLKTDQWFGVYTIINQAHNGYLDTLATGGILGLAGALFVLFRYIALGGRAIKNAVSVPQAWRDGRLAYPTAAFHLAYLLGLIMHNVTESNLFPNSALLGIGFLLCALDLEKWRLAEDAAKYYRPAPHGTAHGRRQVVRG